MSHSWQPMTTAPKDGTKIDILFPYPRGRTLNCYWGESELYGSPLWIWQEPTWGKGGLLPESQWDTHCYPNMEPLCWMPTPELPIAFETTKVGVFMSDVPYHSDEPCPVRPYRKSDRD